VLYFSEKKR